MSTATPEHLVASPGDILEEWLDERGMSQRELADRMGMSEKFISQLINGKASLTPDTAQGLELVSGVSAGTWLRIEGEHRAALKRTEVVATNDQASPFEAALIKVLRDLGVVTAPRGHRGAQAVEVYQFLGVASARGLESLATRHATAFRTSPAHAPDSVATEVAIALVKAQAKLIHTEPFSADAVRDALPQLRSFTVEEPDVGARKARELLQQAGVALVFIPNVPRAHCNGLTLWEAGRAVVGITDRGKREDIFWFTLFHELAHVLEEDKAGIYLHGSGANTASEIERQADAFAGEALIPASERWRMESIQSFDDLQIVARQLGVSPGIVIGHLRHHGLKPHSWGTQWLRKVTVGTA